MKFLEYSLELQAEERVEINWELAQLGEAERISKIVVDVNPVGGVLFP